MPDAIFADPRLAAHYDLLDGDRSDLDHYVALTRELGATSVLDVGCGTGSLAVLLARDGFQVVGVDPAAASLDLAKSKAGAASVTWMQGDATNVPALGVDLAVMTGNVAQVFVTDADWAGALGAVSAALRPGGWFVFETRDPEQRAWERWTPAHTSRRLDTPDGPLTTWSELVDVALPLVTFRHVFRFEADGTEISSESTLRFRERSEVLADLDRAGFRTRDVRDAPDRPGAEFVFVAQRALR